MRYALAWRARLRSGIEGRLLERRGLKTVSRVEVERVSVKCGSAGFVGIDIYNSTALTSPHNPLIIHLPSTGFHQHTTHPPIPSCLLTPSACLASINYRWNIPSPSTSPSSPSSTSKPLSTSPSFSTHAFPTPLHDTLHAYNYLLCAFLPRFSPPIEKQASQLRTPVYSTPRPPVVQRPVIVYGNFLGGTLAVSLALTESFASKALPSKIVGVVVRDAVVDWTGFVTEDSASSSHSSSSLSPSRKTEGAAQNEPWTAESLKRLAPHLFTSPAHAFDAFASPALFFRTAGVSVPSSWPLLTSSSTSSQASNPGYTSALLDPEADGLLTPPSSPGSGVGKTTSEMNIDPTARQAHLKYPPSSSGLKIPRTLFLHTSSPSNPETSSLTPTPSTSTSQPSQKSPASKSASKSATSQKKKKKISSKVEDEITETPASQAELLATLMRRSVFIHEFSDRKVWDEDLDPVGESEGRVQTHALGEGGEEEGDVVRAWIEESMG